MSDQLYPPIPGVSVVITAGATDWRSTKEGFLFGNPVPNYVVATAFQAGFRDIVLATSRPEYYEGWISDGTLRIYDAKGSVGQNLKGALAVSKYHTKIVIDGFSLISAAAIRDFTSAAQQRADSQNFIAGTAVPVDLIHVRFAGKQDGGLYLSGQRVKLGGLWYIQKNVPESAFRLLDKLHAERKNVLRLAWKLGPLGTVLYILSTRTRFTSYRMLNAFTRYKLGASTHTIVMKDPTVGYDIDSPEELALAHHHFAHLRPRTAMK